MQQLRTKVGIVGAGPAGLLLGQLLHQHGIDSVVVENKSEDYVIERVRAGVLEQSTVDLMHSIGVGERLAREGMPHDGVLLNFNGERHRIDLAHHTRRRITFYGQSEVVKDLIAARRASGRPLLFGVEGSAVDRIESRHPLIRYRHQGEDVELTCDFIAGCDGFHGICRPAIPAGALRVFEKIYPFAWLGILAEAPPTSEATYSLTDRGFALYSMRSPKVTRLYLQVTPEEDLAQWPDERIWDELRRRMGSRDGWLPEQGRILQKDVAKMRSFVAEPMRHGRLFLAGDAAHIVPPTGAKGLNLAASDVWILHNALREYYASGSETLLDLYSPTALRRVCMYQRFSWWMTSMLHRFSNEIDFDYRRQLGELEYLISSTAAQKSLAEQYVGRPFDGQ